MVMGRERNEGEVRTDQVMGWQEGMGGEMMRGMGNECASLKQDWWDDVKWKHIAKFNCNWHRTSNYLVKQ